MKRIAQTKQLAVDQLAFYPANPRRGDVAAIKASLEATGQYRAIVVRSDTLQVLAGNHTLAAMRELGYQKALCHLVDVDDEQARRIVLADNRTAELASYDEQALAGLLAECDDLQGTGWDQRAVDELLAGMEPDRAGEDTEPIEAPSEPRTKPGDLWLLGEHRLLCGSSMDRADVERLACGQQAEVMVTDPPYGVAFGGDKGSNQISGDLTQAAIPVSFVLALEVVLTNDARVYLFGGTSNWGMYSGLFDALLRMQVRPIVWVKNGFVLRPNNYHSAFEMVYFGWKGRGGSPDHWYGDRSQTDVWRVDRDAPGDREHPTQKPVEACEIPIRNSCPPAGLVYEPFAGSGSTLIACENLNRRCYAMEIDPGYCDVIVDRFERHTGQQATLDG